MVLKSILKWLSHKKERKTKKKDKNFNRFYLNMTFDPSLRTSSGLKNDEISLKNGDIGRVKNDGKQPPKVTAAASWIAWNGLHIVLNWSLNFFGLCQ